MCGDDKELGALPASQEWRPAPGFEDRYEVSNLGDVRSLYFDPPRLLKPYPDKDGYPVVALWRDQERTQMNLHRLVAETFHAARRNPLHKEVAHLDGHRLNCKAENLKWVSKVENQSHKRLHGTHLAGERHPRAKLTIEAVREIRASPGARAALARRFGVSPYAIDDVRSGKSWRSVSEADAPTPHREISNHD
jgi:hypothetical protein